MVKLLALKLLKSHTQSAEFENLVTLKLSLTSLFLRRISHWKHTNFESKRNRSIVNQSQENETAGRAGICSVSVNGKDFPRAGNNKRTRKRYTLREFASSRLRNPISISLHIGGRVQARSGFPRKSSASCRWIERIVHARFHFFFCLPFFLRRSNAARREK